MSRSYAYTRDRGTSFAPSGLAPDSDFTGDVLTSLEEVSSDWAILSACSTNATVFQTRGWCSAWLSAAAQVGRPERPLFIRVRRRDHPVLIWPLCGRPVWGCHIVHALGEPATQYCDALVLQDCDRASAVAAAWKLLTSGCGADLLYLRRIRDDAAISLLPAVGQMPAIDYAPFVDLNRAAGMAHRSGQRRKTLRKSLRRLSSLGEVVFECIDSPTEKIHAVDQAVALKRAWMRRRGLWSGGYAHPAADTFTRFLAPDPAFKVTVLRVGEHSAGIEAGYVHGDTYWALTKSYDEKFAAMGPGQLLTQWLIDYYAARGMTRLDFLSPEQKYKLEWSTDKVGVRDMIVPVTWRGALLARAMATGLSAVKQVMPYLARLAA